MPPTEEAEKTASDALQIRTIYCIVSGS